MTTAKGSRYLPTLIPAQFPAMITWVAALRGFGADIPVGPRIDLGCGYGLSLVAAAAAEPWERFIGVDLDPVHIAAAESLSARLGLTNVKFRGESVEKADTIAADNPAIVSAHGVYSWIDPRTRDSLLGLFSLMQPGGVGYLSYDALPGQADLSPFHDLSRVLAGDEPGVDIDATMTLLAELVDSEADYLMERPFTRNVLRKMLSQGPSYVESDLLSAVWEPVWSDRVVNHAARYGLEHVGSVQTQDLTLAAREPDLAQLASLASSDLSRARLRDMIIHVRHQQSIFLRTDCATTAPHYLGGDIDDGAAIPRVGWAVPPNQVRFGGNLHHLGVDPAKAAGLTSTAAGIDDITAIPALLGSTVDLPWQIWAASLISGGVLHPLRSDTEEDACTEHVSRFNHAALAGDLAGYDVAGVVSPRSGLPIRLDRETRTALRTRHRFRTSAIPRALEDRLNWWDATLGIRIDP